MSKKLVIIIIVALILVVVGIGAFFLIRQSQSTKPVETMEYSPGEAFVTNIYGTDSLVKLNVVLEIRTKDQEWVAACNNMIRDAVLRIMRSQEWELFTQADTIERMSQLLKEELNKVLDPLAKNERPAVEVSKTGVDISGEGTVIKVYFAEFVMQ